VALALLASIAAAVLLIWGCWLELARGIEKVGPFRVSLYTDCLLILAIWCAYRSHGDYWLKQPRSMRLLMLIPIGILAAVVLAEAGATLIGWVWQR
jgi:hypothetical protein